MPWVRLDDGYPEHPKVDRVGPLAAWLNVCAWAYCARNLTDGFVPEERVARLSAVPKPQQLAERLVEVNLWERTNGGFLVHDYLAYNPSREQVLKERSDTAQRVAEHRARRNGVTPPDGNGASNDTSNARSNGVTNGAVTGAPLTSRTHPEEGTTTQRARRQTEVDDELKSELEEQFWETFGSRDAVRDSIANALGYRKLGDYTDQRAFLRNWVRRDAERSQTSRSRVVPITRAPRLGVRHA